MSAAGKKLKQVCRLWPSDRSLKRIREKVRMKIGRRYSMSLEEMIEELNPILRGWHNYFQVGNCEPHFRRLDRFILNRLRIFVKRKHSDEDRGCRRLAGDLVDRLGLFRLARVRVSYS